MADSHEAKDDIQVQQWYNFCAQMRGAAAEVIKGVRAGDEAATEKAMENLNQSCDDCHAVFHMEEVHE